MSLYVTKGRTRVSLKCIADEAGVSIGSVSSVLNNRHSERRISVETAARIRAKAQELRYVPNISAKRLRSSSEAKDSVSIALIANCEVSADTIKQFVLALRNEANRTTSISQVSFMIDMFQPGKLKETPGLLTGDHFNGAIVVGISDEDNDFLSCNEIPVPLVLVNREIPRYSVVLQSEGAGDDLAKRMQERGRSKFLILHCPAFTLFNYRLNGFLGAIVKLPYSELKTLLMDVPTRDAGRQAIADFFSTGGRCDGVFAPTDALALGAYQAIKDRGLSIPGDISVVGFGEHENAIFFEPQLSVAGNSACEIAESASRLIFRHLLKPAFPERIVIPSAKIGGGSL